MPEGDGPHVPRWHVAAEVLAVLVLVAAGLAAWGDLGERWGLAAPDPSQEPALVEPPDVLDLPAPARAVPVAPATEGGDLDPAAVRAAVGGLTRADRLGRRFALVVADVDGDVALQQGPRLMTPASTTKMLTAAAALDVLGAEHRFATTVRRRGSTLVLVGGGDPFLASSPGAAPDLPASGDLRTLARAVADRVGGGRFSLRYDAGLFTGPEVNPQWPDDYLPDDVVSPITALWVDEGRVPDGFGAREDDPARAAALVLADHLRAAGVRLGGVRAGGAGGAATEVARVPSATVGVIAQHVLEMSDNEAAEVLARHVALAQGLPASYAGGVRAVREALAQRGVRLAGARWYDGSGLSRRNRLSPLTLVDVLAVALEEPALAGAVSGLPVAGFTGSLTDRFDVRSDPGLGRVRAKTGTLTGVSALAGTVRGRDGSVMLYAAMTDSFREVHTLWVRARLDQVSAALAACRCAAG